MPTYEYRCPEGHEFEVFQRISDPLAATCPRCGADAERILSGGAGLIFKGSGFYITDYKRAGQKEGGEGGEKKPETKKESGGGDDTKAGGQPKSGGEGKKD